MRKKLKLKPGKPEPYDGRPDAQVFHKFMCQTTEYLSAFDVEPGMLASHVSNFLKGNAYNFWVTTVESKNPCKWSLKWLFVKLFNYCFLPDYCLQMHEWLRHSSQPNQVFVNTYMSLKICSLRLAWCLSASGVELLGLRTGHTISGWTRWLCLHSMDFLSYIPHMVVL